MTNLVNTSHAETHVVISIDDGKANALSFDMLEAINRALDEAEAAGKVVVIAGRPGKFSAGFDLKIMGKADQDSVRLLAAGADLAERILTFATPVVLAVSGHALAMGAVLCMAGDYRIGIEGDFKLGLNEVAIGMTLPWFAVELARGRLATEHFTQSVALARIYDPHTAISAGYLDEIVAPDYLLARAVEVAEDYAKLDMVAHKETKIRIREELMGRIAAGRKRDFGGH